MRYIIPFFFVLWIGDFQAQDVKIEKLKTLYNQGHYKMVYRRAGRLMMNPAYEHIQELSNYRTLAAQELSKDNPWNHWAQRHAFEIEWMPKSVDQTQAIIQEAENHLGIPYKFGGNDTNGFDCSGFVCYVFEKNGQNLPRRAVLQYEFCQKVSSADVRAGDLVFFAEDKEVSHVGIIVSAEGTPKKMIHASSSKGIIITELENSPYWQKRLVGFGRIP